jgi:KDO2-lipid IV(A) lauroyltransferase
MLEKIKHKIEAFALTILFKAFTMLPLDIASALGGWLAWTIGPFLSAHKTARMNLQAAFPDLTNRERNKILDGMWENLGRNVAELTHLPKNDFIKRIKITGAKNMPEKGKAGFLFSGHLGNWELLACVAQHYERPITAIYRGANNPLVDEIISKIRASRYLHLVPKGGQGAVKIIRAIKNKEAIGMLVDQKMNDGIEVPFFGRPAMTAPAIAELALRYDVPILPARVIRTKGAHFEVIIYPPLAYTKTGDTAQDTLTIMTAINSTLESWIREHPDQWFWVHKRWPK